MPEFPLDESRLARALAGRRVLLTGHTGFKGGWLALWLNRLGAETTGVALAPDESGQSLFAALGVDELLRHRVADIRSEEALLAAVADVDAEIVIHMAAQSLVRPSYAAPVETFHTNVVGTAVVLEAARRMPSLRAVIIVTSDKCYENEEWVWGYRENDRLGGADPYSASKGCAEIVAAAYARSFFRAADGPLIATVRAGNVFGGGDWSTDRLIPDIMRAAQAGRAVQIRNPASVRPWQHVLEPLAGYLQLAAKLIEGDRELAGAWNFGPDSDGVVDVATLARSIGRAWGDDGPDIVLGTAGSALPEAGILRLDSTKAKLALGWRPRLKLDAAIDLTVEWYRAAIAGDTGLRALSERQIADYVADAAPTRRSFPKLVTSEATACA